MLEVMIDAASQGNPGKSGGGIVIKDRGMIEEYALPLGILSNHEAEFKILCEALKICREREARAVWIKSDSKIVCDSVEKRYVKNQRFQPYLQKSLEIIDTFDLFFIKWIPERENLHADRLAKKAIHKTL